MTQRFRPAIVLTGAALAAAVALAGCGHGPVPLGSASPSPAPAGTTSYSFDHDGLKRTYNLHVPAGLDRTKTVPLVIELHGGGGDGNHIDGLTGFYALADREGFVVAAPSGADKGWNDGRVDPKTSSTADDVGFLAEMIDRIEAQVPIDPRRVYACHPARPVPVLEIHGTADPLVPYAGGTVVPQLGDGRGQVVGVDAWSAFWAANNSAGTPPATTSIGTDTTVRTWHGATPQSDVVFYRVEGAGHTWPGGSQYLPKLIIGSTSKSFDASEVIWQFLSGHRLAIAD